MKSSVLQFAALLSLLALPAIPAGAQQLQFDVVHASYSGPMDRCQPTLPSHDAAFRKRPLAMQNEGATTAFVTCAFDWDKLTDLAINDIPNKFFALAVWFTNRGSSVVEVSCTAVFGRELEATLYSSQSVTIGPGTKGQIEWSAPLDMEGYRAVSVSCGIPPGVGVNESLIMTQRPDFY